MPKLGDILKSINSTKDKDLIDKYNSSDYVPFIINRGMSFYPDTILHSNNLNCNPHLDKELQYKYYLYAVKKKNRYAKWLSNNKTSEKVKTISKYYSISIKKAKEIEDMISDEDLKMFEEYLDVGGVSSKNKK